MSRKLVFLWAVAGLVLCTGITLIALGASYLKQYNIESTTDENYVTTLDVNVEFDEEFLRLNYYQTSDKGETISKLSVHVLQNHDGRGSMDVLSTTVTSKEPIKSTVKITTSSHKEGEAFMEVKKLKVANDDITCFMTSWKSDDVPVTDCIQMEGDWFGGAEMYLQGWPINKWDKFMSFYLSGDMFADAQQYGSVIERYWLSSKGVAIYVPNDIHLHASTEELKLCLKGSYEVPYNLLNASQTHKNELRYITCFGTSSQKAHDHMLQEYFQRPSTFPDLRMMKSPIWSTWARYKININQSLVLEYANEIKSHGFSNSQLEIDDGYEKFYGDHTFDPEKFPNAPAMIQSLHDMGFRVTTWVTPFINPRSKNYDLGDNEGYFIKDGLTNQSGRMLWWNGIGSSIDFTNPEACDWYVNLLENVRQTTGVDSFKFDAGEINYVTSIDNFQLHSNPVNIGTYTQRYGECAVRLGNQIELRAAWNCQHLPVFVRMMDKDSNWSEKKGLKTIVPTALTFSILGYPYILPDMIGGNAYEDGFHETVLPDRELYIRWLEVTAFLPSMQFSVAPWQYDAEVTSLALDYVTLHETTVFDELKRASQDLIDGITSIGPIRPIWWVTHSDPRSFKVDDEFLVGEKYLVAPVITNATRSRDIYLPGPLYKDGVRKIAWKDKLRGGDVILGGVSLIGYDVALEEISWWEMEIK